MSSPFASRFHTNYCPTDDELAEIKALLVQPRIRLQDLDETIRQLQTERDKLAAHIAAHEALISPIRRIPLDMLQEIFVTCLPTERNSAMSASEAPVLLGRICTHWRTVAFQTPSLWARVHILEPQCPSGTYYPLGEQRRVAAKTAQRLDIAKRWLDRSGQYPLSISFYGSNLSRYESPDNQATLSFLRLLTSHVARWRIIDLRFRLDIDTFAELTQLDTNSAPLLQNFALNFGPYTAPGPTVDWTTLRFLKGSETLSECSLDHCGSNFLRIPVDWGRLTRLKIFDFPPTFSEREIVQLLSECAQLQTCAVSLFGTFKLAPLALLGASTIQAVNLPVRDLVLGGNYSFITHITCPELRRLTVSGPAMPHAIVALLSSSVKLETLQLDIATPQLNLFVDILHALPDSLVHLSITRRLHTSPRCPLGETTLTTLSSTNIGPHLEVLFLEDWQHVSADVLVAFLRSRIAITKSDSAVGTFRCLRVVYDDLPASSVVLVEPDSALFLPFIQAGIDITIQYLPSSQ
ncbi:hypothetical protein C8F01DRAFT_514026 [Mycena amicta]|nr:hypothetical protein C8F01DRAFT_514026 [Mycena amicta]